MKMVVVVANVLALCGAFMLWDIAGWFLRRWREEGLARPLLFIIVTTAAAIILWAGILFQTIRAFA